VITVFVTKKGDFHLSMNKNLYEQKTSYKRE